MWTKRFKIGIQLIGLGFSPFIIHFPSSETHSHFDFHNCLHVGTFLRVKLNFIREVVVLILVAQLFPVSQHSMILLLRAMPRLGSFFSSR